jgi:hypothetical protein
MAWRSRPVAGKVGAAPGTLAADKKACHRLVKNTASIQAPRSPDRDWTMDVAPPLQQQIRELIDALVAADYTKIATAGWLGRLRADDLHARVREYGARLVTPPPTFMDSIEAYPYKDGSGLHLDVPLWTAEEGLSDLTLSLEVLFQGDDGLLHLHDLRVL